MMRLFKRICTLCLVAVAGVAAAQIAPAAPAALTAQERLDAIRQSLVETALKGATQVRSTQWLDMQGQLRDSSTFRSGMEVRGVRVLSYSRDPNGQALAQLDVATPPKDLGRTLNDKTSDNARACARTSDQSLRHVVGLNILFETGTSASIQKLIRQQIQQQWFSAQDMSWRMLDRSSTPAVMSTGSAPTAYERALTSHQSTPPPWTATLRIRTEVAELKAWERLAGIRPHHTVLNMDFSVQPMDGQDRQFQATNRLTLPLARQEWSSPSLEDQGVAQLISQWQLWAQRLDQWMGCESLQTKVSDRRTNNLQINVGSLAGVRPGDEWLLADPQSFPSRLIDKQSASMLLAKVVEVTAQQAKLTVLAGSAQAVQSHWRAWPAESLNR